MRNITNLSRNKMTKQFSNFYKKHDKIIPLRCPIGSDPLSLSESSHKLEGSQENFIVSQLREICRFVSES